jgi:hypothetical protein
LSPHRKIQLGRTKAILVAAGALSITAAAPATAATAAQSPSSSMSVTATPSATPSASPSASPSPAPSGSPKQIATALLGSYGWSASQFSCLDPLWAHESDWSVSAYNAGSGAYGIPQAAPGSKMASPDPAKDRTGVTPGRL